MKNSYLQKTANYVKLVLWPIEKNELKIFIPMSLMMLCMLFNFGALRSLKDGIVIPTLGAEVISFLKLGLVLPSSIIFTIIYVKLSNIINAENLFYLIIGCFLVFFFLFAYVILPYSDSYHPNPIHIDILIKKYPNFQWILKIIGKWSYAVMYVFAELWSVVVINLMFWQFANNIFTTKQAKRIYPVLGMIGNMGLILAGSVLIKFSKMPLESLENINITNNEQLVNALQPITLTVILSGIIAIILFKIINSIILKSNDFRFSDIKTHTKTKLSFVESVRMILHSKYIGYIVGLILCYGLIINILEGPWKSKVRELYPNNVDYINFMGKFNVWMGISSVVFMILGSNIMRKVSWFTAAILTPLMLLITGTAFFTFVNYGSNITFYGQVFNPLYAAVIAGAVQNILSKSAKYSLFDSTKEMSYIPLSLELKTKGKAAVEVVALKLGKSMGAFVQSGLFILMPFATFDSIINYLMFVFFLIVGIWIWDIKKLNKEYLALLPNENK